MKDTWINHNTDKMLLFFLTLLNTAVVMFIILRAPANQQAVGWATGAYSTIQGALILILTGRIQRSDGQTANGVPPTPNPSSPNPPPATGAK